MISEPRVDQVADGTTACVSGGRLQLPVDLPGTLPGSRSVLAGAGRVPLAVVVAPYEPVVGTRLGRLVQSDLELGVPDLPDRYAAFAFVFTMIRRIIAGSSSVSIRCCGLVPVTTGVSAAWCAVPVPTSRCPPDTISVRVIRA